MASLVAQCPKTRAAIDTGISLEYKSLAKSWDKSVVVRSPHCDEDHTVKVRAAYVKSAIGDFVLGRS